MNFSNVNEWTIPEGSVIRVTDSLNRVIWEKQHPVPPTPENDYFYVKDITGAANTLSIRKDNGSLPTIEVFYSTDKQNWTSMGNTDTTAITATIPANSKLYLKAVTNQWSNDRDWGTYITASGNYNIGGNLNSLILGDNYDGGVMGNYSYIFSCLFKNSNTLISAANLELSGVMQTSCYSRMFQECRNLITAPALPTTTLIYQCYYHMFDTCTSLTTAPALPATTLTDWCYKGMFQNCSALTTAPALPATTLTTYCYCEMFNDCIQLSSVTTYANDISATACLTGWLNNVSATGDFYNLGSATYPSGASGIPSGWTIHTL